MANAQLIGAGSAAIHNATDAEIERAAAVADPMAARGVLYQLTGDEEVASVELTTVRIGFLVIQAVARAGDVEMIRARLVAFLKSYRDDGGGQISFGPLQRLPRSLGLACGEEIAEDEVEMWIETLALDPWVRSVSWSADSPSDRAGDFQVVVVGGGIGGLNAAAYLRRLGLNFTLLERNSGVGGVWHENRYPGCRVDTQSRTYTHLIGVNYPLKSTYCTQEENQKYVDWMADSMDLRRDIEFNTEVNSLIWDDEARIWEI